MPYIGSVELSFRLSSCNNDVKVPFLVTEQYLDSPFIGFNVMEEIIKVRMGILRCPKLLIPAFLIWIVRLLQTEPKGHLQGKHGTNGKVYTSTLWTRSGQPMAQWIGGRRDFADCKERKFKSSGITNNTNHEIVLRGRTLLGRLQVVQSETPVEVKIKEPDNSENETQQTKVQGVLNDDEEPGGAPMGIPTHKV